MNLNDVDPKGLIRESYRIDGITLAECRTIFFDWAVQVPVSDDPKDYIQTCLDHYSGDHPDHPMTQTLTEGLAPRPVAKRRGGRAKRVGG
ncbi:MAG: hypothetical protein AAF701_03195 [Pseudomonadota bacterium]